MSVTRRKFPGKRSWRNISVKAGILKGETYPPDQYRNNVTGEMVDDPRAGMPVAVIAAAINYGMRQRVARPFMNITINEQGRNWLRDLRKLLQDTQDVDRAFATVGQIMKEDIQHTISTWPADNSDAWAAIKGFNHGLVMSSHLLKSVESEVTEGARL